MNYEQLSEKYENGEYKENRSLFEDELAEAIVEQSKIDLDLAKKISSHCCHIFFDQVTGVDTFEMTGDLEGLFENMEGIIEILTYL